MNKEGVRLDLAGAWLPSAIDWGLIAIGKGTEYCFSRSSQDTVIGDNCGIPAKNEGNSHAASILISHLECTRGKEC